MVAKKLQSPCTRRCTVAPGSDICVGCYRTVEEIVRWTKFTDAQRQAVMDQLEARRNAANGANRAS
jgi:predicted Fe-S protein YdhL (DUF1289 family)